MMKVCVFGSLNFEGGEKVREKFCRICRELGATLADRGHQIIIGSDASYTADRYVVEGANTITGNREIVAYVSQENPPFSDRKSELKQIKFTYKNSTGPWPLKGIQQVEESDAVILIGGTKTVMQVGHIAPILRKPVLAIPTFDGSAKELWNNFFPEYNRVLDKPYSLHSHAIEWSEDSADVLIKYLEQLVKRNPYSIKRELVFFFVIVLLLAIWLIVLLIPVKSRLLGFFLLLVSASWLGTCLRTLVRMISNVSPHISWRELILEGIASVVLAFGLGLIYLTGALTATGDLKLLDLAETGTFLRIGITASLLGLAAGLLLEQATDKLKNMLGKIIGE